MHLKTFVLSALLLGAFVISPIELTAQIVHSTSHRSTAISPEWYIGLGGGINFSSLHYSNIDKSLYPKSESNFSGVFSVFAEYDFGSKRQYAIRPQFSYLTRGGKLTNIGRDYFAGYNVSESASDYLSDVKYQLQAKYLDFRLPLIYQFGRNDWTVRPYVYVAPIVGFVNGGFVDARFEYAANTYSGVRYDVSKANMKSIYVAGAVALGLKWQFDIGDSPLFLGLEANYQLGLTDTYSSSEKNGEVANTTSFFPLYGKIVGTRKINAFEVEATVGVPLSIFKKKSTAPARPLVVVTAPAPVQEPKVEEHPCYTLDEVVLMLNNGENVEGKVICAIEDNINFEFSKSDITPSSYTYLNTLADLLKRTNMRVRINGHTDAVGSNDFNMELSRKRAQAVMKYLVNKGVDSKKLSCAWYGYSRPIAPNDTEAGRKQNRRVEFEILNNNN